MGSGECTLLPTDDIYSDWVPKVVVGITVITPVPFTEDDFKTDLVDIYGTENNQITITQFSYHTIPGDSGMADRWSTNANWEVKPNNDTELIVIHKKVQNSGEHMNA